MLCLCDKFLGLRLAADFATASDGLAFKEFFNFFWHLSRGGDRFDPESELENPKLVRFGSQNRVDALMFRRQKPKGIPKNPAPDVLCATQKGATRQPGQRKKAASVSHCCGGASPSDLPSQPKGIIQLPFSSCPLISLLYSRHKFNSFLLLASNPPLALRLDANLEFQVEVGVVLQDATNSPATIAVPSGPTR